MHNDVPVVEVVNNWRCASFADTYAPPLISDRLRHVLHVIQPDVLHVHNLHNLSFDLVPDARRSGAAVVATLHDYTLVCPSGGQRVQREEAHICHTIDPDRCARCFGESPYAVQMSMGRVVRHPRAAGAVRTVGRALLAHAPRAAARVATGLRQAAGVAVAPEDIRARLAGARAVLDDIDLLVAPSSSIAEEFARLGADHTRVRVSDYGLTPIAAVPRREPQLPIRVGTVGTLAWHKGVHVAIEAVRTLPPGTCELRVFGHPGTFPDYTADLRARAALLPVTFMGGFDEDQVAGVFADIDLLLVPSLWLENSPLVIHEAFMAGVPVVGSRIGGIATLVQDGWNGALVEPGSPQALGCALRRLVDRPATIGEWAARLPRVKSIAEDACQWEAMYADVLAARARTWRPASAGPNRDGVEAMP